MGITRASARAAELAVVALLATACQQVQPRGPAEGSSAFVFVPSATAASEARQESGEVVPQTAVVLMVARPIVPLEKPLYPKTALGRIPTPVLIGVRILVDESGRVTSVGPSLRAVSTHSAFSADFFAAVEDSLQRWRFTPAEKRHMKVVKGAPGNEDYWLVTRVEKTDYAFDLSFTFSASGDVQPDLPAP